MFSFKPSKKYLLLLLFIIPFSFTKKFHDIWEKYVIDTLLTHFEKKLPNDVIVLAFMVIIICQLYQKIIVNRYIFSLFQQISVVFTLIVYVIYRFNWIEHSFTFTKFSLCTGFVYWDLIIFIPCIVFMFFTGEKFFIVDLYYKLFPTPKRKNGFILDIPKEFNEINNKSTLKTKKQYLICKLYNKLFPKNNEENNSKNNDNEYVNEIITELVKKLLNTESKDNAFAVGVVGEWGTGKTTLLNQIKYVLEKENNKPQESIIVDFNPWNSTNSQSIITDFFEHFREELSKYSAEIDDSLQSYTQKLASIEGDDWLSKGIKIMTSLFGNNKTMIQEYAQINRILTQINRQIFVFIDDLDRLDKKEIIEVIRLIRNSANFHNTFFIVAYEKSYVEQAIEEELNQENKSFFLEKIFQLELHLPKYEYEIIAEYLYKKLIKQIEAIKDKEDKEKTEIREFIMTHEFLSNIIQNFRDVKRFVNAFSLVYTKKLAEEVYFPDFFHLELLRFKYPLVYDLLKNKTDTFLILKGHSHFGTICYIKNKDTSIEEYLIKYNIYLLHIENIKSLLLQLFYQENTNSMPYVFTNIFSETDNNNSFKIRKFKYFFTYFAYNVSSKIIRNQEFNLVRKDINLFKEAIDKWYENNLRTDFMKYCSNIKYFKSDDEKEIFIEGIFYAQYLKIINFDMYNEFIIDLFNFKDNNKLKIFAQNLFNNAKPPYIFESKFLEKLNSISNDNFILSKEERINYLIQYLKWTAEQLNKYDGQLMTSFSCTVINSDNKSNSKWEYPQQAKNIVINFLKEKDLIGFLEDCINPVTHIDEKDYYYMSFLFRYLFNSNEDFEIFLNEYDNNTRDINIKQSIQEFLQFYNLSKANNFKADVPILFKKFNYLTIKNT